MGSLIAFFSRSGNNYVGGRVMNLPVGNTEVAAGMGRSESDIKKLCPGAKVGKGLPIRGGGVQKAENDISAWLRESGLIAGSPWEEGCSRTTRQH